MVTVAIVGAGGIAKSHAETLSRIADAEIVSVYDVDFLRAAALAKSCGAMAYSDLDACIRSAELIYILTPPSFHKDIAIAAMEEGKHVMIEKPIAITLEDAEAICEAAARLGRKAMVGFNMRYRPGYNKLKRALESGTLGEPIGYWSQRMGMGSQGGTWRTNAAQMSGFTIESISHDVDIFRWLSGSEVECVYGEVANSRVDLPGYDDHCAAVLRLRNGQTASIQASWCSYLEFNNRGISGTRGTAMISGQGTWNFDTYEYRTQTMERPEVERFDDPLSVAAYFDQNVAVIECVKRDTPPPVTAEDGYRVLRVSHAILQAHRERRTVVIPE